MTTMEERYGRAEALLPHNLKKLISCFNVTPNWIGDTDTLWYKNPTSGEFFLVDAAAGTKTLLFDRDRLAKSLSVALESEVDAAALPLSGFRPDGDVLHCTFGPLQLDIALDTYSVTVAGQLGDAESVSPDGRWALSVRDFNLVLRSTDTGEERQLTTDGEESFDYGGSNDQVAALVMQQNLGFSLAPAVVWSPDSTRFVTHRIDQRRVGLMHLVRSSPFDGGRPQKLTYHYALPGDEDVAIGELLVFDRESGAVTARSGEFDMPFVSTIAYDWVWWSPDQTKVHWLQNDRGDKNGLLQEPDAATGALRTVVHETSDTQILYGPQQVDRNVRTLASGEVLFWSERSGWGHLYLYDADGSVRQLTDGDWMVRKLVLVDESARRVVFTAGGLSGDPYLQQLCSVSFDGGEITPLTHDDLDHTTYPSPSERFFVDVTSRWDTPPVYVVRNGDGEVVLELEKADASGLLATGWTPPARAVVKAADGVTDVYCAIYTPSDFDPSKSYPVLDCIYPGPQMSCAPQRFPLVSGALTTCEMAFNYPNSVAELGFVVVIVDGRGGAMRSREFQSHSRVASPAVFVDDHVVGIQQLAETRPWMDLSRVGIYGYSAGGFGSARAFLQRPDFFKVCVSSGGNHDNRVNHSWWGEKYFGLVEEFDFAAQANASLADNLRGKLLLCHGEMDDNATPHGTMRLVDALIAANKDFDLLLFPNCDHHMMFGRAYFTRRRWDYFVKNLMGETPPNQYLLGEIPVELGY